MATCLLNLLGPWRDLKQIMCTGVAPQAGGDYAGQLDGPFVVLLKQEEEEAAAGEFNITAVTFYTAARSL